MLYCRTVRTIVTLCLLAAVLLVSGCMMPNRKEQIAKNEAKLAGEGYSLLEPGSDSAPAVDVTAVDGTTLLAGGAPPARPLLLYFVTAPDTPNSAKEVHQLNRAAAELGTAGVAAAVVLPATPAQASDYRAEHCPDLPVVADADLSVSIPFGCAIEGVDYLQRTEVGIAADGTVAFFERGFPLNSPKLILEAFGIATIED
jgi:peroxiredoxin